MTNRRSGLWKKELESIDRLYMLGVEGDAEAVLEADRRLESLRNGDPDHPLAKAYHGGIKILIARDRKKPMEKLRLAREGLKLLDEAAAAAPADTDIRILRGRCSFQLPEKYFARTKTAIEDYNFLMKEWHRGKLQLETGMMESIEYELGEAYRRIGKFSDAAAVWKRLYARSKDKSLRERLAKLLRDVQGKQDLAEAPESPGSALLLVTAFVRRTETMLTDWMHKNMRKEEKKKRKKRKK